MITLGELTLSVILAFGIGFMIGSEHGWTQSCVYAKGLAKQHATGERLVQTPRQFKVDAVVYGSEWLAANICEGR